ncbi:MAG TPA: hypothetical protein VFN63_06715 [Pseudolabrys sp.]|nr:hypothetical protein [Pseudolabrys sp.]
MTRLFIAMLILGLAGCTSTSSLFTPNEPPTPPPAPAESAAPPPQGTQQAGPRGPMTPAASAAASPGGAAPGELLECVTQSCKINCSQKVKPQFRPKWCANFKSPD